MKMAIDFSHSIFNQRHLNDQRILWIMCSFKEAEMDGYTDSGCIKCCEVVSL